MRLLNFKFNEHEEPRLGALLDHYVLDVRAIYENMSGSEAPDWFRNTDSLLSGGSEAMSLLKRTSEKATSGDNSFLYDESSLTFCPALIHPSKMLMIGVNYASHVPEPGAKPPTEPYVWVKLSNTLLGHNGTINVPHYTRQPDNEIELGVVIGKRCRDVTSGNAMDYVAGYTIMNDFSFRDLRNHPSPTNRVNFLRAKNLDGAAPLGPYIVTKDEVPDPYSLKVTVIVNDKEQQSAMTTLMTHKIPALIEYISRGITLEPGDLISTGTPLENATQTGVYLKDGDVVRASIDNLGELKTKIRFL